MTRASALLDTFEAEPLDEVVVGDAERAVAAGLVALQAGDHASAVATLEALRARIGSEVNPNVHSALALAHAADGSVDAALREADEVDGHHGASHLDRILAGLARGLSLGRRGDHAASSAALDQVRAAADATDDVISQALARLADATAASARGELDAAARWSDAEARLAALDLSATGWRRAFSLGVGAIHVAEA